MENYLENGLDMNQLPDQMHEIMGIFVFQASRRLLLSRLMNLFDTTTEELEQAKEEGEKGLSQFFEKDKSAAKGVPGPNGLPPLPVSRHLSGKRYEMLKEQSYGSK